MLAFSEIVRESERPYIELGTIEKGSFNNRKIYTMTDWKLNKDDKKNIQVMNCFVENKSKKTSKYFSMNDAAMLVEEKDGYKDRQSYTFDDAIINHEYDWTVRSSFYLPGSAGSGKSYKSAEIMRSYVKYCKTNNLEVNLYVISEKKDDETFSDIEEINYMSLENDFDSISYESFPENSLILFDDFDGISNAKKKKSIVSLANNVLSVGRARRVHAIITSHVASAGNMTKMIVSNVNNMIVYPAFNSHSKLTNLLHSWFSSSKHDITKLLEDESRSIRICKMYGKIIYVSDSQVWVGS